MLIELGVFLALVIWVSKTYVAERISQVASIQDFQLAAKLDPGDSAYQLNLGRVFQYSLTEANPDAALRHLKRAAGLNPYDPQVWLDLGAALEFQGKTVEAEACLRRADFLAPGLPDYQWAIGNFFLLHGNVDEAFRHFKAVLDQTDRYDQILFSIAWKASGDAQKILTQLIPISVPAEFRYLFFLLAQGRFPEARSVWERIASSPEVFDPPLAGFYMEKLIAARRIDEAARVWNDLRTKGLIKPPEEPTARNLVVNGDFEEPILNFGFDWRMVPQDGVITSIDDTVFHSPGHSLLIQFRGKQNLAYQNVYQYVRVRPGRLYGLRAFMKTSEITTDSGPRLEVRDANDPGAIDKASENLTGSTTGWTPILLEFKTGPKTELIVVVVIRPPSQKFDNLIAGKVWLDDVSLVEVSPETGRPAR